VAVPLSISSSSADLRLTINGGGDYRPGDRVRVQVEPAEDGYLVVFRVDGDGRVRVLFPIDPDLDPFVRGGRKYELRGRGERETFLADDRSGSGLLYAAISRDPLDFRRFATGEHWDYSALRLSAWDADAEPELTQVVKEMAGSGRFTYDVLGYRVYGDAYISGGAGVVPPWDYGIRDPFFDPYWSCLACGYGIARPGVNVQIGLGLGRGWYDPWDPWYGNRFGWGNGFGYGGWYDPWGWNFPGQYRPITVINLPRPQIPNTAYGYRARPRGIVAPASLSPDLGRVMRPDSRPTPGRVANDGRSRPRGDEPTRVSRPSEGRSTEPQRTERGDPPRSTPPSRATGGSSGSTPPASSGGTSSGRSRRPGGELDASSAPIVQPQMDRRADERPRSEPVITTPSPREVEPQPVFREPFRARPSERTPSRVEPSRGEPQRMEPQRAEPQRAEPQRVEPSRSQPVYREPPRRVEPQRAEPQRSEPRRAEPVRSEPRRAEPARTERSAPPQRSEPVIRSAPPPSAPPSTPPASSGRSRRP
jgi:hypothetical protein